MEKEVKLKVLAEEVAKCTSCNLHQQRIKSVFARGNSESKLVFLGEAPGRSENEQGLPFVGRAGKLLDDMIAWMGMSNQVYIMNVVKCWPPGNRKPLPEEVSACSGYLISQLSIVNPRIIVTLGATATDALLGAGDTISKRRGKIFDWNGYKIVPSFHPSYLLRNPSAKKYSAQDLTIVKTLLLSDLEVSKIESVTIS